MSLPKRFSIGPGNNEVGIIGRREAHQFLPFRFIGIDRDNMALFLNRKGIPFKVSDEVDMTAWRGPMLAEMSGKAPAALLRAGPR